MLRATIATTMMYDDDNVGLAFFTLREHYAVSHCAQCCRAMDTVGLEPSFATAEEEELEEEAEEQV